MHRIHQKLLESSGSYRAWHDYPKHPFWHWATFLLIALGSFFYVTGQVNSYRQFSTANLEIASDQIFRIAAITDGLVGYWNFDEGSGTTAADSSGTGNTGTLINGPAWTTGKVGNGALSFDGADDYVNIPSSAIYDFAGDFTVSAWVNIPVGGAQGFAGIVGRANGPLSRLWVLEPILTNRADFQLSTTVVQHNAINNNFVQGQWQLVTGVLNGTTATMYVNAVAGTPKTISGDFTGLSGNPVSIGSLRITINPINASIDEIRIYNRALSAAEILDVYNYTGGGDTTPPVLSTGSPTGTLAAGTTSTTLFLTTNENATCKYGTTAGVAYASIVNTFITTGATSHSQNLSNLTNGASYNYYVRCQDAAGNANITDYAISFSVASTSDTTAPTISGVAASSVTSSGATITWTTNENSDSQVDYGLTTSYGSSTTLNTSLVTSHSQALSGLSANTLYHYRVKSKDAAGNLATSGNFTFTTSSVPLSCSVVTPTGSGSMSGGDWNNAFPGLPATLNRGYTYYLADGTYPGYLANTANSGTTPITIKKAISSDHCVDTGWNLGTMGSGVATLDSTGNYPNAIIFSSSYWVIDGQSRTSLNSGHGISLTTSLVGIAGTGVRGYTDASNSAHHITIRYVKIVGSGPGSNNPACNAAKQAGTGDCIMSDPVSFTALASEPDDCDNLTLQYVYLYDAAVNNITTSNCSNALLEYSLIEGNGAGVYYHGQGWNSLGDSHGTIVRHNVWKDIQGTAFITMIGGNNVDQTAWEIYGNVFYHTPGYGGAVSKSYECIQSNNPATKTLCDGLKFYNNSIVNVSGLSNGLSCRVEAGQASCNNTVVENNLWYGGSNPIQFGITTVAYNQYEDVTPTYAAGSSAGTSEIVQDPGSNLFVNWASGDFHLTGATTAGLTQGSPYNIDPDAVTRGTDGVWDRGAYEFISSVSDTTPPSVSISFPSAGATVAGTITLSATASDDVAVAGVQFRLDGANLGAEDTSSPYSVSWDTTTATNGSHTLTAVARDAAGNQATSASVSLTVNNIVVDTTPPSLSSVTVSNQTASSATLSWTTSESATSILDYGLIDSLGFATTESQTLSLNHSFTLSNLISCAQYRYRARSFDGSRNPVSGSIGTFSTKGCPGDADILGEQTSQITNTTGGSLSLPVSGSSLALGIPTDFTTTQTASFFQILRLSRTKFLSAITAPSGKTASQGPIFHLQSLANPTTLLSSFSKPLTLTLTYTDADISGLTESSLKLYRYANSQWDVLSCTQNGTANTLTCPISGFSSFLLAGDPPAGGGTSGGTTSGGGGGGGTTLPPSSTLNPPTNLQVTLAGSKVNLTWTNPQTFSQIVIVRKVNSTPASLTDGTIVYEGQGTSFIDETAAPGTNYFYAAFATDGSLNSSTAASSQIQTAPASPLVLSVSVSRLIKYPASPTVYLLENSQKRGIPSYAIYLQRFRNLPIATIPETQTYPDGATLSFPPGSLIKSPSVPAVYLILDNSDRYGFRSAEEFFRFGFRFDLVDQTTEEELSTHPTSPIQSLSYHATGNLIKYPSSPTVYRVENNAKRGFSSPEIFFFYGDFPRVITIDNSFQYPDGAVLTYPEGALLRTAEDPTVFIIENNTKRAYTSAEEFLGDGYSFEMVRMGRGEELSNL